MAARNSPSIFSNPLKSESELKVNTPLKECDKVLNKEGDPLITCLGKFPEPLLNLNLKTPGVLIGNLYFAL